MLDNALEQVNEEALRLSKESINEQCDKILAQVNEGVSPISFFLFFKFVDSLARKVKPKILESAVDEFYKNADGGKIQLGSSEVELMETSVKYDYSSDPIWAELKAEREEKYEQYLKEIDEEIKNREAILKATTDNIDRQPQEVSNEGEVFTRRKPPKESTTTLKIKIK